MKLLIYITLLLLDVVLLGKACVCIFEALAVIEEYKSILEEEADEDDCGTEDRRRGNQQTDDEGLETSAADLEDEERGRGDRLSSEQGSDKSPAEEDRTAHGRDIRAKTQADQDFGF